MRGAHRHADAIGEALAQRTGGDLNAGRQSILRMAGSFRSKLAKVFDLVERQIVAGQMQQRIKQHRAVAGRKQKPIAIFPLRILRVVPQEARPKHVSHRRGAQRQTGMARFAFCTASSESVRIVLMQS